MSQHAAAGTCPAANDKCRSSVQTQLYSCCHFISANCTECAAREHRRQRIKQLLTISDCTAPQHKHTRGYIACLYRQAARCLAITNKVHKGRRYNCLAALPGAGPDSSRAPSLSQLPPTRPKPEYTKTSATAIALRCQEQALAAAPLFCSQPLPPTQIKPATAREGAATVGLRSQEQAPTSTRLFRSQQLPSQQLPPT